MLVRIYQISEAKARWEENIIVTYYSNKPAPRLPPSQPPLHSSRLCRWLALALSVVTCQVVGRVPKIFLLSGPLSLPGDRPGFCLTPCRTAGFVNQRSGWPPFRPGAPAAVRGYAYKKLLVDPVPPAL